MKPVPIPWLLLPRPPFSSSFSSSSHYRPPPPPHPVQREAEKPLSIAPQIPRGARAITEPVGNLQANLQAKSAGGNQSHCMGAERAASWHREHLRRPLLFLFLLFLGRCSLLQRHQESTSEPADSGLQNRVGLLNKGVSYATPYLLIKLLLLLDVGLGSRRRRPGPGSWTWTLLAAAR